MRPRRFISLTAALAAVAVAGCAGTQQAGHASRLSHAPAYQGVDTRLLDGDLVSFVVAMDATGTAQDVEDYAECAAAQYTLIRGYGFARHVRTNVEQTDGLWQADAVYTISPALPRGAKTIDAEVVVDHCLENGIPTV